MQPVVNSLEADNLNRLNVRRINREASENADIVDQYQIRTQPVYILLDAAGNEVKRWFGAVEQAEFEAAIDAIQ